MTPLSSELKVIPKRPSCRQKYLISRFWNAIACRRLTIFILIKKNIIPHDKLEFFINFQFPFQKRRNLVFWRGREDDPQLGPRRGRSWTEKC